MTFSVGDVVLANWSKDDYWYVGVISVIEEKEIHIQFFDGDFEVTTIDKVKPYHVEEGMDVEGLWNRENYYRAKIAKINGPSLKLHYYDGDISWLPISLIRWP